MSRISSHVLDISKGRPAEGMTVILKEHGNSDTTKEISRGKTNPDGRIIDLACELRLNQGSYEMIFEVESYFAKEGKECFYPRVSILFKVSEGENYHIPLLLSPFGYSTYRGS